MEPEKDERGMEFRVEAEAEVAGEDRDEDDVEEEEEKAKEDWEVVDDLLPDNMQQQGVTAQHAYEL